MKAAHNLYIERFERVASRLNEIHACVNAVIHNVHPIDFVLSIKIGVKALLNVLNNGTPGRIIVDKIAKSRRVNNGQT